jgi:predicted glycosyltransferase involved in capsule biosynthesis
MYERKYPNIVHFIKLDNHLAPGNVRNIGINYTYIKSEYTWFIDSDDYLYSNNVL